MQATCTYTGKYHEFVAVVLLQVRSTNNNAEGNKRVIFSGIAWYYGDTDFIIQTWNSIARSSTNERSKCA